MADYLNIAGRIRTTASDGVAMEAHEVKDLNLNKSQQEVNADVQNDLGDRYTKEETYNRDQLNELITTPDVNRVYVIATNLTTAVTDLLPATGSSDTLYNVGNWDGTQYDTTVYSIYGWDGTAYVCLAVRSFIGEVYDISANHPDGQGNPTPYADLTAALGTGGANVPVGIRRGGMSIKFIQGTVQSSDNKYVQYRLMATIWSTDINYWQGVDYAERKDITLTGNGTNYASVDITSVSPGVYAVLIPSLKNESPAFVGDTGAVIAIDDLTHSKDIYSLKCNDKQYKIPFIVFELNETARLRFSIREDSGVDVVFRFISILKYNVYYHSLLSEYNQKVINDYCLNAMKPFGILSFRVPVVSCDDKETILFTSSSVTEGKTLYYSITLPDGLANGYNAYIELLNANNERLAIYGKTSLSSSATQYTGSFEVPVGFSYAKLYGTCQGAYLDFVGDDVMPNRLKIQISSINTSINNINGSINTLSNGLSNAIRSDIAQTFSDAKKEQAKENLGISEQIKTVDDYFQKKTITLTGNGSTLVQKQWSAVPAGTYAVLLPRLKNETSAFDGYTSDIINIQDSTHNKFLYLLGYLERGYGVPYTVFTLEETSTLTFRIAEDEGVDASFNVIYDKDINILLNIEETKRNRGTIDSLHLKDTKSLGILAYGVQSLNPTNYAFRDLKTRLFDSNDVSAGDTLYFRISLPSNLANGNAAFIELLNSNDERIARYGKTDNAETQVLYKGSFEIPNGFSYARFVASCAGVLLDYIGTNELPAVLRNDLNTLSSTVGDIEDTIQAPNLNAFTDIGFYENPIVIFENDDSNAIPNIDDGLLNLASIIKVSENMYYLYYECKGLSDAGSTDAYSRMCFAYSTDGFNYIKGFPQGITPPVPNSTELFQQGTTPHGSCVVKVDDVNYPYRLIGNITYNEALYTPSIYKSADGVNWIFIKALTTGGNDSPISCVVRGNLLKIFIRTYGTGGRTIGILYTDINGNLMSPYKGGSHYYISLKDETKQLYQASAAILDDHREILLPTIYNPTDFTETVNCIILDDMNWKQRNVGGLFNIIPSDVKSIYFGCGRIEINGDVYAIFTTRDSDHQHFEYGTTKSAIKIVKVDMW